MEQDGQDGASDPDDGDDSDSFDSEGEDGDGGGDDDGGDSENGGGDGNDYHAVLLAKEWTIEIHFDLHGDAYYHLKLLSLIRCYHTSVLCSTRWSIGPTRLHWLLGDGGVHPRRESGVPHPIWYYSPVYVCSCYTRCCLADVGGQL